MALHIFKLLTFVSFFIASSAQTDKHECDRECEWPPQPRTCEYEFKVEWYYTMSKACYECPFVAEDCNKPHCIAADGVPRSALVVNRKMPGPQIRVCHGDTIKVKVSNHMDNGEGLSIHWHGIYQKDTQHMDGVAMLTQCPIPVMTSFQYKFKADPPGTHWWHAHSGMQRADGLAGALIVNRPKQTNPHNASYDIDSPEYFVMMSDWLHKLTLEKFEAHHHSSGSNKGESFLINGKGVYKPLTDNGTEYFTPREIFHVEKNKRYRFRIVNNAVVNCPNEVTIDNHTLTIISSDGVDVEPYSVTTLIAYGGERYDFVLTTDQPVDSYWFRVQGMADCVNQSQMAIIRYDKNLTEDPVTTKILPNDTSYQLLNPFNTNPSKNMKTVVSLNALYSEHYPEDATLEREKADEVHFLGFDFYKVDNPTFNHPEYYPLSKVPRNDELYTPMVNNVSWKFPDAPLLTQPDDVESELICNPENSGFNRTKYCDDEFCSCAYVIDVKLGSLVEFVLYDEGRTFAASHPFHLHGYHFAVVAMDKIGESLSTERMKEIHANGEIKYKLKNAPRKDTVIVPDGGYTVIRFVANNPGVWFLHCHLEFHQSIGMATVVRVGYPDHIPKPPGNFPQCGSWDESSTITISPKKLTYFTLFLIYLNLAYLK